MGQWSKLSAKEKAQIIKFAIDNGVSDIKTIRDTYNVYASVDKSNANFVQRLESPNRNSIPDWETDKIATHKLSVGTDAEGNHYIYPEVQEIDGKLVDYTRPPYSRYAGMESAEQRGDTIHVPDIKSGVFFTEHYKELYPGFRNGGSLGHRFDDGGGAGIIPINVTFKEEYPEGMNLLNAKKQQQLFDWYENERQRVGNAFTAEQASRWATQKATEYVDPNFLLPTMTVTASRTPKRAASTQPLVETPVNEMPAVEEAPTSRFVVQEGPKWQDSYRDRPLGVFYGREMSDTVPANTVPDIVRMAEDWYRMIQPTHPDITEDSVVNALNSLNYVRAGAYTGEMGGAHATDWGHFSPSDRTLVTSGGETDAHELEHALRDIVLGGSGKATKEEQETLLQMFPTINANTRYAFGNHNISEGLAMNNEIREILRKSLGYSSVQDLQRDLANGKITDLQLAKVLEKNADSSGYMPYGENIYRSIHIPEFKGKDLQYLVNEYYSPDNYKLGYDFNDESPIENYNIFRGNHALYNDLSIVLPALYGKSSNMEKAYLDARRKGGNSFITSAGRGTESFTREDWKKYDKAKEKAEIDWYNDNFEKIKADFIEKTKDLPRPFYYINEKQKKAIDAARKALQTIALSNPKNTHFAAQGGQIHIAPSKRGTFTAAATKHGKSVQEFARQVLANKENYSPAMVKKANFARNAASWKHSTGGPLYPFSFQKNPYWKTPVVRFEEGGKIWGNDLALNRATTVHSNYEDAKDLSIPSWRLPIQKKLFYWGLPSALSNCTLTATQWVDPTNPIMSARTIFNNPKLGYTEINAEDALPGDLLIAKNPKKGTYHTMMIEGFDSTNQPILRYSKGGAGEENLRTGMTLSGYHAADIEQKGNHTEDHYFRYSYPNEFWLPEITVTASKK